MTGQPRFSIVVPVLNEAENIPGVAREIAEACQPIGPFEVIFVNDGSTDATAERIAELRAVNPWVREVRHARPCGKSAALRSGARAARAPTICTIDGDGQNPPAEIPKLVTPLIEGHRHLGLVAGQRVGRQDTASKKLASRLANRLRAAILRDATRDTGCGLKASPRDLFLSLPYFDNMHRYLPALVRREGYEIELVDVAHRARMTGTSKYTNLERALVGALDLPGVFWLLRRRKLPQVLDDHG